MDGVVALFDFITRHVPWLTWFLVVVAVVVILAFAAKLIINAIVDLITFYEKIGSPNLPRFFSLDWFRSTRTSMTPQAVMQPVVTPAAPAPAPVAPVTIPIPTMPVGAPTTHGTTNVGWELRRASRLGQGEVVVHLDGTLDPSTCLYLLYQINRAPDHERDGVPIALVWTRSANEAIGHFHMIRHAGTVFYRLFAAPGAGIDLDNPAKSEMAL